MPTRPTVSLLLSLVSLVSLAGCVASAEEEASGVTVDSAASAVVGGAPTDAFPAMGALIWFREGTFCSAFLLAPRVVMTAAHCIDGRRLPDGFFTGSGAAVTDVPTSASELRGFTRIDVNGAAVYPGFDASRGDATSLDGLRRRYEDDVALVRLAAPASAEPLVLDRDPPETDERCTIVGYGADREGGSIRGLRKRTARVRIAALTSRDHLEVRAVDGEPARGDSGSPLLCGGRVKAVYSFYFFAKTPSDDRDFYQRTSGVRSWVVDLTERWGA